MLRCPLSLQDELKADIGDCLLGQPQWQSALSHLLQLTCKIDFLLLLLKVTAVTGDNSHLPQTTGAEGFAWCHVRVVSERVGSSLQ